MAIKKESVGKKPVARTAIKRTAVKRTVVKPRSSTVKPTPRGGPGAKMKVSIKTPRGGPGAKNSAEINAVKTKLKNAGTRKIFATPQDKRNEKIAIAALSMLPAGRAVRGGVTLGKAAQKVYQSKAIVRGASKLNKNVSSPKSVIKDAKKITKESTKKVNTKKELRRILDEEGIKSKAEKLRIMEQYDKKKYAKIEEDIYQQWRKDAKEILNNELNRPKRMDDLGDFDAKVRAAKMKDRARKLEADRKLVEDAKRADAAAAKAAKKSKPKNPKPQERKPSSQNTKPNNSPVKKKPSLLEEALKKRERDNLKSELAEIRKRKEINQLNESFTGTVSNTQRKLINESVKDYNARLRAYQTRWNIK
jgi:hypothetical protein